MEAVLGQGRQVVEQQIQYAKTSDGVSIAYCAIGQGPAGLHLSLPSHLEASWQIGPLRMAFTAAAQYSTLVRLDLRGCGLSDRDPDDSRMNVGQILETHLGWASRGLGKQIEQMIEEHIHGDGSIKAIRDKLEDIYGEKDFREKIAQLNNSEILELAENLKSGVPMANPVFDGADESHIVEMLKMAKLEVSGQVYLYDGRTGDRHAGGRAAIGRSSASGQQAKRRHEGAHGSRGREARLQDGGRRNRRTRAQEATKPSPAQSQ